MNLYQLNQRFLLLLEQLEISDENPETLEVDDLFASLEEKHLNYAKVIDTLTVEADAIKRKRQALQDREKALHKKIDLLKGNLIDSMSLTGISKVKDDEIMVTLCKPREKLQQGEIGKLPVHLIETKQVAASASKITAWIKEGNQIEGWAVIESPSIRIK